MSLTINELVVYQSQHMPENDTDPSGGALNQTGLVVFAPLDAMDSVNMVSDDAADNRILTITGRLPNGIIDKESGVLNGLTPVSFSKIFERFLKFELSGTANGKILIRRNADNKQVVNIPAGVTSVRGLFCNAVSGNGQKKMYEKVFVKNLHSAKALTDGTISLAEDPTDKFQFALAGSKNDNGSVHNRLTAPEGLTFLDAPADESIPGGNLAPGEAIGVWLEMTLGPLEGAFKSMVVLRTSGASV